VSEKYFMVDGYGEPKLLEERPTVEEVKDNEGTCFLSAEVIRGDEIVLRKAVVLEAEGDAEEDELDWEKVS